MRPDLPPPVDAPLNGVGTSDLVVFILGCIPMGLFWLLMLWTDIEYRLKKRKDAKANSSE